MKFYLQQNSVTSAFLQIFKLAEPQVEVTTVDDADIVLVTESDMLRNLYRSSKFFVLLANRFEHEKSKRQPKNVFIADAFNLFRESSTGSVFALKRTYDEWVAAPKPPVKQFTIPSDIVQFDRSYSVLVVDDTPANLDLVRTLLVGQQIVLARGPEEAMRYLNLNGKFDAVLTDMQMLPDKAYPALNLDQYGVTETIHSGFGLMFEATRRGMPVAIVTDGNHHSDWASAMFDSLKEATVNGQKVLFFNNIGKRWDKALKSLLG